MFESVCGVLCVNTFVTCDPLTIIYDNPIWRHAFFFVPVFRSHMMIVICKTILQWKYLLSVYLQLNG